MPYKSRCVFGCTTAGVTVHNFPPPSKDPERFKMWVNLAGPSLNGLSDEEIYLKKKVCDIHFTQQHKNRNNRLSALAVPTLFLPELALHDIANTARPSPSGFANLTVPSQTVAEFTNTANPKPSTSGIAKLTVPRQTVPEFNVELHNITNTANPKPCTSGIAKLTVPSQTVPELNVELHNIANTGKPSTSGIATLTVANKGSPGPCNRKVVTVQQQVKNLKRTIHRLKKRGNIFKTRLENAEKLSNKKVFQLAVDRMNLPSKIFTMMQFRETRKKPKGRRFTLEEKILSLSLYKKSPKAYHLLKKCFTLPSANSLKSLLSKITISPGINELIFSKIKESVTDMSEDEKICVLIFDEMYITPQIHYNHYKDEMKGFTTVGRDQIADHVLVFMIRGIKKNFKQPVAYYFTQCLNRTDLKQIIKNIIKEILGTGLKIVATVCDQSTVNVGAIDSLIRDSKEMFLRKGKDWKEDCIYFHNTKIVPLYDVPHLLKGLRNNIITKDLIYYDLKEKIEKKIKWEYFQSLYEADKSHGELRILQKITEEHVVVEKINKMKVKTAAQIFSHSVAIAAEHLYQAGKVSPEIRNLTQFCLFVDQVFDSLNCNQFICHNKMYRAGVKKHSPHHQLWIDAIKFFKRLKFLEEKRSCGKIRIIEKTVPTLKNFVKTIEGMQAIWKILSIKHGFDTMLCRNFNQDPIENFFGNVRSLGVRNVAPNCVAFEGAYKSLLLSNFSSLHSIKANCEEDIATYLHSINFLLENTENVKANENVKDNEFPPQINISSKLSQNDIDMKEGSETRNYVCGWVLKKCFNKICKSCKICREDLTLKDDEMNEKSLIMAKEYVSGKRWLVYPSKKLNEYFYQIQENTVNSLKNNISFKNTKLNIKIINDLLIEDFNLKCKKHNTVFKKYFEDTVINVLIFSWCRSINKILTGKIVYDGDDENKTAAQIYYNKHRHNKSKK